MVDNFDRRDNERVKGEEKIVKRIFIKINCD